MCGRAIIYEEHMSKKGLFASWREVKIIDQLTGVYVTAKTDDWGDSYAKAQAEFCKLKF